MPFTDREHVTAVVFYVALAIFGRAGRLTGAVSFSRPRLLMQYRRLIADGATFDDALVFARST